MKYQRRNLESIAQLYLEHLDAIAREELYSNSAIAAEFAYRDDRLKKLESALRSIEQMAADYVPRLEEVSAAQMRFETIQLRCKQALEVK